MLFSTRFLPAPFSSRKLRTGALLLAVTLAACVLCASGAKVTADPLGLPSMSTSLPQSGIAITLCASLVNASGCGKRWRLSRSDTG